MLIRRLLLSALIALSFALPAAAQDDAADISPQQIIKLTGAVIEWHWCHRVVYQFVAYDGQVVYVAAQNPDPRVREIIALAISQGLIKARLTLERCPGEIPT